MPWTLIPKALITGGKFIVKGLMKAGPKLLKLGKKLTSKTGKAINKAGELLTKQKGSDVLDNTPKFTDIAKKQIENTLNKKFKGKGLLEKITNQLNDRFAKATGFDYKKSQIKHKNIEILKKNGVPLSEILRMDKEGILDSDDSIMKEYKSRKSAKASISKELQDTINKESNKLKEENELAFLHSKNEILKDSDKEKLFNSKAKKYKSVESSYENEKYRLESSYEEKISKLNPKDKNYLDKKLKLKKEKLTKLRELKLKSQLDDYREAHTLSKQSELFKEMLIKSLVFNGKINNQNAKSVMQSVLGITENLNNKLSEELGEDNDNLAEMIQKDHNLNNEGLEKLAEKIAETFDATDERNTDNLNAITDKIVNESATFINKQLEEQGKVNEALFNALKEMNKAAEARKAESDEKSKELSENATEDDKLAKYGIGNILKSQNSVIDLIMTANEKGGGIDKIFDGALTAMMKGIGEDVGFWGTGLAIALKKIPEAMMASISGVLNTVLAPLNKLMAPLGNALAGAFGWAEPYKTPEWINTLSEVPVLGKLAGGLDWISSKVMSIPYALKSFGEDFANGDAGLGDVIANGLLGIPKFLMGGVSDLLLTVMGIPTDILSSKNDMKMDNQSNFEQSSFFVDSGDSNAHDSAESIAKSNINDVVTNEIVTEKIPEVSKPKDTDNQLNQENEPELDFSEAPVASPSSTTSTKSTATELVDSAVNTINTVSETPVASPKSTSSINEPDIESLKSGNKDVRKLTKDLGSKGVRVKPKKSQTWEENDYEALLKVTGRTDNVHHELPNSDILVDNAVGLLNDISTESKSIDKNESINTKSGSNQDAQVTQTTIVQPAIVRESASETRVIQDSDAVFSTGDGL